MLRRIAAGCLLAVTFAACGNGEDTAVPTTAAPSPAPTPCSLVNASTEPRESDIRPETAYLTDVRYSDTGCPRIVLEFRDHEPDYLVEYRSEPFSECGSGETVPTDTWGASAFLTVRLEPAASADLSQPEAPQTYEGARDIEVDGDVLKHLRVICDFEAVLEWVIGLDAQHGFTVVTLDDPPRVVIDISET